MTLISSEDPTIIVHLDSLSDKDFKENMWKMFKELKQTIEHLE